jgi:hypothetical protein
MKRDQLTLNGCGAQQGAALQRKADAPLRPAKEQKPVGDLDLFSDRHTQSDLIDLIGTRLKVR